LENSHAVPAPASDRYAWYVLVVLVVVYVLNFIDRQILSILAVDIKRDLNLTDADLGFLYGTAFGVFYALFGIPLGRLADSWHRIRLMTIGLSVWSLMTALSGFSRTGGELAAARLGVGIGEATASPCAYSLLSDYFPKEKRATALAIYSSGLYLGGGGSLFIGGLVVKNWNEAYPAGTAPFGLVGWQAAFLAVGLPGLLLAILVATLKEPLRGQSDGIITPPAANPFRGFFEELTTVIPPLTLIGAARRGMGALSINVAVAATIIFLSYMLIRVTGDIPQWTAIGIGVYAVFSWATALKQRDPPAFELIWGTPAFIYVVIGYGLIAFTAYALSFWGPSFAVRDLGASLEVAGFWLGGSGALGGFIGVILGGKLADHLRKTNPAGRMIVALIGAIAPLIPMVIIFTVKDLTLFYALNIPMTILSSAALGASAATALDLVLPRMRGTATATFFIGTTLVGLALGPYMAGKVSTLTGDLATGILSLLLVAPISIFSLAMAYRLVPKAEASLIERARAAGEPI
jgi:MFS family permease